MIPYPLMSMDNLATSFSLPTLAEGDWVLKMKTVDTNGVQSDWSEDIMFEVGI